MAQLTINIVIQKNTAVLNDTFVLLRPIQSLQFMQTLDFVSGLHNCLEFSQPLSCLYQDMQTRKMFSIAFIK